MWGGPKNWNLLIKKLCIYSYMFKLQSPSKYSLTDTINLLRHLFPLLKTSFELMDFDAISASTIFHFTSCKVAKCFLLKNFFHKGKQKKVARGEISCEQGG